MAMEATKALTSEQLSTLYETDYLQWITTTVEQLRCQDFAQVDWTNLLEEIEDMGKRERRSLKSNLIVLLLHLLKWQHQLAQRTGNWAGSIVEHRRRICQLLEDSPSLQPYLEEIFTTAYQEAVKQAAAETLLPAETFPKVCEFELQQAMDDEFPPIKPD